MHDILSFRRERTTVLIHRGDFSDLAPEVIHFCRRGHHRHLFHGQVATAHVIGSVCDLEGQPELATSPATKRGKVWLAVRSEQLWPTSKFGDVGMHISAKIHWELGLWYIYIYMITDNGVVFELNYCGFLDGCTYPGWLLGSPAYKMSFLKIVWETSACSLMWMPISGNELWSYVLTYHINIIYIYIYNPL